MLKLTVNTIKNDSKSTQEFECELKASTQEAKGIFVAISEDLNFVAVGATAEDAVSGLQNGSVINEDSAVVELRLKENTQPDLTTLDYHSKVMETAQEKLGIV